MTDRKTMSGLEIQVEQVPDRFKQKSNVLKPFISWDGEETRDAGYCLFGNSAGMEICHPQLSTKEMLELIFETGKKHPNSFHVAFSFYYDVNQIIKDVDRLHVGVLHRLKHVTWGGYLIEYIPHKIFTVSKLDDVSGKRVKVRIDDVFSFFRTRYDKALVKYGIGTEEERRIVTEGKDQRDDFWWRDIEEITQYWRMELRLMVDLMDTIRKDANNAGFFIGQWHGPGAFASYALRKHGMGDHKRVTPEEILPAVRTAFAGGWFERFKAGVHDGPVYTADINSAYAYAASLLPSLAAGKWRPMLDMDEERRLVGSHRLALYRVRYVNTFSTYLASCHGIPLPLFMRQRNGDITRPFMVDGWYHAAEARLVRDHPNAEFLEGWVFEDDGSYPFRWLAEYYDERLRMQDEGNPAEKILKWVLASVFGRTAQRVGWNERDCLPPAWHQLEWSGWITSFTREMMFGAASSVAERGGLVSIDTDGVTSTVPFPELPGGEGSGIGQWKLEAFKGLVYVQNGIYWLKGDGGEWIEPKLRGIPKHKIEGMRDLVLQAMDGDGVVEFSKRNFFGYGIALQGGREGWDKWRSWIDMPHKLEINHSGGRQHVKKLCRSCRAGYRMTDCLHDLALVMSRDVVSAPHELPWLKKKVDPRDVLRHLMEEDF